MIKTVLSLDGGGRTLVLGLSRANCEKLLEDKPIFFYLDKMPFPTDDIRAILLIAGENEVAMLETLDKHFGPSSKGGADAVTN